MINFVCNSSTPEILCSSPFTEYNQSMDNATEFEEWPLERVVSAVVPLFFGIIGLAGLLGNVLVVLGEFILVVCAIVLINIFSNQDIYLLPLWAPNTCEWH